MTMADDKAAAAGRPSAILAVLGLLGRLAPLRRYCYRLVGRYVRRYPERTLVEGRIAGLSAVLDLEQTMERTIYLRGMVDVRGIALMRWALRDVAQPVIFDVGANVGNHSAALRDIAGHIYAFEPNPALLARLNEMIVRNGVDNITAVGLALSDRAGAGRLSVPAGHSERAALKDTAGAEAAVDVEVTTGDSFIAEAGITRLNLVKIDVEGHEPAVLAGLAATLERLRPIVVFERYATGPAYSRDAFARLLAGYRLFGTQKRKLMVGAPPGYRLEPFDDSTPYAMVLAVPEERARQVSGRAG